ARVLLAHLPLQARTCLPKALPYDGHSDVALRLAHRSIARLAAPGEADDVELAVHLHQLGINVAQLVELEHRRAQRRRDVGVAAALVVANVDDTEITRQLERRAGGVRPRRGLVQRM